MGKILSKVLAVGNYMNGGSARGQAYGVKLDVLMKMINVKASNAKMGNLLSFVAKSVHQSDPNGAQFYESWVSMWAAAEVPYKQLEVDLKLLNTEIDRCKMELNNQVPKMPAEMGKPLEKRLKDFLAVADPRLQEIKIKQSQTEDAVRAAMTKYGEGGNSEGDVFRDFFTQMTTFTRAFKNAVDANIKEQLEEAKRTKAASGGGDAASPTKAVDTSSLSMSEKPKENIFGNFNANKGGSQADIMAEFKARMAKKKG